MHALCCSCLPFDSDDTKELVRKTTEDPVLFSHASWANFSFEVIDLIRGMLEKEADDRATLEDVFKHPWFERMLKK